MVNWNKPVRTKSGHKVRILCQDKKSYHFVTATIVGLIEHHGVEYLSVWNDDGVHHWSTAVSVITTNLDAENIPTEKWVNIYVDKTNDTYYVNGRFDSQRQALDMSDCPSYVMSVMIPKGK